jgi:phosphoglycerate dehydrogenase-like enzyme
MPDVTLFILQVDEVGLEQVPDVIQNYHICIVKNRRIDSDIIARATQMKIIMQNGVGLEGDYRYAITGSP